VNEERYRARPLRAVRCGKYEIDLEAGELRKNGLKVRLQEQPFKVLARLIYSPGELVTREELQERLWGAHSQIDSELGLNTAVKKLRTAFGDSADNPRFIETLPKRGYGETGDM
jgi:DNA-binding winged helix-turn-helix (wHTH) protein